MFTQDGMGKDMLSPKIHKENPDGFTGQRKWKSFVKEELIRLKPDVAVLDFLTPIAFTVCEELGIKVV